MEDPPSGNDAAYFRPLGPGDAALLADLYADCFEDPRPWDAQAMADLMAMPGAFGFVVYADESPQGYLMARLVVPEAEVISLAIEPSARRGGLARSLLQLMIRQVEAVGGARIFLEVAETNEAARGLYDSLAFREVGRRPGYYHGKNDEKVTALVMAHNIHPTNS